MLNDIQKSILQTVSDMVSIPAGAVNIRLDGQKEPTVSLHADKTVAWDEIIKVMNVAKNNGYKLIAATSPE